MKVSYNWLNKYFDGKLPEPAKVAEALTFHAWEIEEMETVGDDTVLDVNVLPDKAMWALSHRGIAKDLSTILNLPLVNDPLKTKPSLSPTSNEFEIKIDTPNCRRFAAGLIRGVKVGPSPDWLRTALEAIGQRSINNVVDASNYVMYDLGQPSHAFDANKLPGGFWIRQAKDNEILDALDEFQYTFTTNDTLISSLAGKPLSIAGIKGGQDSGISDNTTDILVEVANWDPVTTRKTSARLKLRSDASSRYENGVVPEMVPYGLAAVTKLILEVAGGELVGYQEVNKVQTELNTAEVSLEKINSVLGVSLSSKEVTEIADRFGFIYQMEGEVLKVESPFERTDLVIAEDVIEEIGRIYGYEHIEAVVPDPILVKEINKRFYYSEVIRETLVNLGFSEIFTSSFREKDVVKMANAFASDKGYLRSTLVENMKEALTKNAPQADLLGLEQIKLFEIGTVFDDKQEQFKLCLGIQSPSGYKPKKDEPALLHATSEIAAALDIRIAGNGEGGILEIDLDEIFNDLPNPTNYLPGPKKIDVAYQPFSIYPAITRDIAMWVPEDQDETAIVDLLKQQATDLCVRVTLFDRFTKDGQTSYAYRLVFQSPEKTLENSQVDEIMEGVYQAVSKRGFTVR